MKKIIYIIFLFSFLTINSYSQVTNLLVQGVSSNFTAVSGSQFSWSYDVPTPGDTSYLQIWIDTDNNGILNNTVDVLWQGFIQIDGDPKGQNGPPDMSGGADGHVSLQMNLGLAPAHYIMYFKNHNVIKLVAGVVTALPSPTFTISGNVGGVKNVVVNLESRNGNNFWTGITDASGNYSIKMNSDTSGNPWRLRIDNPIIFNPDISTPDSYTFTIDPGVATTYPGYNFSVETPAASISGTVYYENGQPAIGLKDLGLYANDGNFRRSIRDLDSAGHYTVGIKASELSYSNFQIGVGDPQDTNMVAVYHEFYNGINSGDNLVQNFTYYKSNAYISGRITIDGNSPNQNIMVIGLQQDSANVQTWTNNQGYYRLNVTSHIYSYTIQLGNYPMGYTFNNPVAHPGDTNANINLVPTDVKTIDSNIPADYSLSQNYPNPFNPSTLITYEIPKESFVTLSVYNILGQEITKLVNKDQPAGKYSVDFNAENLTSGIYFYRIQAGDFTSFKKMILMK